MSNKEIHSEEELMQTSDENLLQKYEINQAPVPGVTRQLAHKSIDELLEMAQYMMDQKLVPSGIRSPQAVMMIIKAGDNLGMDPITSLGNIDFIEGSVAIRSKMLGGILTAHGIGIQILQDDEPIIEKKPVPIMEEVNGAKVPKTDSEGKVQYYRDEEGNIIYKETEIDRITTIRFTRYFKDIGVITNDISFRYSMAKDAGWTEKSNWKKMRTYMMSSRCLARGARIVASDLIGALYTDEEVRDFI